mmetsp:Transcript_29328/g.44391  ORF Transcript_29328/g.44391 Transcript_29328/m.44391 type:complete len:187 (+) Transcript_29328:161-721(+)
MHEEHDNSMAMRSIGAIATRPTGNHQGGHYFISLCTGKQINQNQWTELPMPNDVIQQVHCMASRAKLQRHLTITTGMDNTDILDDNIEPENDNSLALSPEIARVNDEDNEHDKSNEMDDNDSTYQPDDDDDDKSNPDESDASQYNSKNNESNDDDDDWCVANKDIKGSQCTIIWHVDDLKISHKMP